MTDCGPRKNPTGWGLEGVGGKRRQGALRATLFVCLEIPTEPLPEGSNKMLFLAAVTGFTMSAEEARSVILNSSTGMCYTHSQGSPFPFPLQLPCSFSHWLGPLLENWEEGGERGEELCWRVLLYSIFWQSLEGFSPPLSVTTVVYLNCSRQIKECIAKKLPPNSLLYQLWCTCNHNAEPWEQTSHTLL